jgi:spore germination cell wall hydrolase CwlJ-like protein
MNLVFIVILIFTLTDCKPKSAEVNLPDVMNEQDKAKLTVVVEKKEYLPEIKTFETALTEDEKMLLARVVHAEAGNQDMTGKRLVVDCVLNRVDCEEYPNHVFGVVLQDGQFIRSDVYTQNDMEAVEKEMEERLDYEIMYFRTGHYHEFGTALYQHGDHFFSGR